jgi:hypothetical protein
MAVKTNVAIIRIERQSQGVKRPTRSILWEGDSKPWGFVARAGKDILVAIFFSHSTVLICHVFAN